ncbi:hypothetical protein Tco_0831389 [Tanacetum coccineum]
MKPLRFQDESSMAASAFVATKEEDTHEPLTYQEAVACKDSSKWKAAMKKEMDSLRKNKIWELQSPMQWYKRFDEYMLSNEFKRSSYDSFVYYRSYAPDRDCDVERMGKVPYANSIRSLMYLMVCMRPHIATNRGNHVDVTSFVDSDYTKDSDKGRSITGYTFLVQGCVVTWKATLQHVVALSTTEAEYMALTEAVKEAIWLRGLLEELGIELNTMAVNCDNHGTNHLSRNHVFHERTKHINVRYQFIREVLEANTIKVLKVGTEHNVVDALTKVIP